MTPTEAAQLAFQRKHVARVNKRLALPGERGFIAWLRRLFS